MEDLTRPAGGSAAGHLFLQGPPWRRCFCRTQNWGGCRSSTVLTGGPKAQKWLLTLKALLWLPREGTCGSTALDGATEGDPP